MDAPQAYVALTSLASSSANAFADAIEIVSAVVIDKINNFENLFFISLPPINGFCDLESLHQKTVSYIYNRHRAE